MKKILLTLLIILSTVLTAACSENQQVNMTIVTEGSEFFEQAADMLKQLEEGSGVSVTAVRAAKQVDADTADVIAAPNLSAESIAGFREKGVRCISLDDSADSSVSSVSTNAYALGACSAEEMFINEEFASQAEVASEINPVNIAVIVGDDMPSAGERAGAFASKMKELLEMKYPQRVAIEDRVGELSFKSDQPAYATILIVNDGELSESELSEFEAICATTYGAAFTLEKMDLHAVRVGIESAKIEKFENSIESSVQEFVADIIELSKNNVDDVEHLTVGYSRTEDKMLE